MSFQTYKKNRKDIEALTKAVEAMEAGKSKFAKDERFYKLTLDKAGNGSATLRFLPAPEGEDLPVASFDQHNFNNEENGLFLAEYCALKIGRPCAVHDAIKPLWNIDEDSKKIAASRNKKSVYICNVLVLKDKEAPENVGKVFLFRFGIKIWEKIKNKLKPEDPDRPKVVVFDFYDGANFYLKCKKVFGYNNYDDSEFESPSPLYKGDDRKLEEVYNQLHKLTPFTDESNYKSYDEVAKKYDEVVNGKPKTNVKKAEDLFNDVEKAKAPKKEKEKAPWTEPEVESKSTKKTKSSKVKPVVEEEVESDNDDSEIETDTDSLDYYEALAEK